MESIEELMVKLKEDVGGWPTPSDSFALSHENNLEFSGSSNVARERSLSPLDSPKEIHRVFF